MIYRVSISVFSEDPRSITSFVEKLKSVLEKMCRCVEFAFANSICECGSSLLSMSIVVDRSLARGLLPSPEAFKRSLSLEVVIVSPTAKDLVSVAEIVKGVAKEVGVGVRASL